MGHFQQSAQIQVFISIFSARWSEHVLWTLIPSTEDKLFINWATARKEVRRQIRLLLSIEGDLVLVARSLA